MRENERAFALSLSRARARERERERESMLIDTWMDQQIILVQVENRDQDLAIYT